jgi:hypothetical protein
MEVEWLILADSAQVVGNKLYLLGGGWEQVTVNAEFPVTHHCAVAVAVRVPWNETNQKHSLVVEVASEVPGTEEPKSLLKLEGQLEVGRPPGTPLGQDQRVQLAFEANLKLETPGTNVIIARIEGVEMKRTHFNVVPSPMLASQGRGRGEGQGRA